MKKLTLKDLAFQKGEVLTRSQLKNVLGGGSGSPLGSGSPICPASTCGPNMPPCQYKFSCESIDAGSPTGWCERTSHCVAEPTAL